MYTGLTGALYIEEANKIPSNPQRVAYISGWNIENTTEIIEMLKVGKVHKDAYTGHQSWSASAEGAVVFEEKGQEELFIAKRQGKKIKLDFYLDIDKGTYFYGHGYIESLNIDFSAADAAKIAISVKGTGPLDLYVEGKNFATEERKQEMFFKFTVDEESGKLLVVTDEVNEYLFDKDVDGYLKVSIGKR